MAAKSNKRKAIELQLLADIPVKVGKEDFSSPTLKSVVSMGENKFLKLAGVVFQDYNQVRDKLIETSDDDETKKMFKGMTEGDVVCLLSLQDEGFRNSWEGYLSMSLRSEVLFETSTMNFYSNQSHSLLTIEELNELIYIGRVASGLTQKDLQELNEQRKPANKKAQQLMEKLERNKRRVQKYKKVETLYSLILGVSEYANSINLLNVWDLTYYQFQELIKQTRYREHYDEYTKIMTSGNFDTSKMKTPLHWSIDQNI